MAQLRPVSHEDRLSLVEHLTELRVRIVICLVTFLTALVVCFWQNDQLLNILNKPLTQTQQNGQNDPLVLGAKYDQGIKGYLQESANVNRRAAAVTTDRQLRTEYLKLAASAEKVAKTAPAVRGRRPVTLGVSEPFLETLKVAGYAAFLISLPLILFQLYAFVLPAFSPRERQVALPAMLGIPVLFITGVVFGYYTVVPSAIKFLQNFNTDAFDVLVQAQPYYKFVILLLAAMGLLFQIPVGLVAVTRVGIVSTSQLAHNRRYAILVIAVLAMLLPGQDPVTMTMLMVPMYVLFEGSILLSWLLDRRDRRSRPAEEEEDVDPDDEDDEHSSREPELVTFDQD
jgi:sec-independent protein translocase protein TatC